MVDVDKGNGAWGYCCLSCPADMGHWWATGSEGDGLLSCGEQEDEADKIDGDSIFCSHLNCPILTLMSLCPILPHLSVSAEHDGGWSLNKLRQEEEAWLVSRKSVLWSLAKA
jgi:hypothetical protein